MKRFFLKIISIAMIICMLFLMFSYAFSSSNERFNVEGFEKDNPISKSTETVAGIVISILRVVGVTVALVMLLVIAMKYMTSAPGDRADIKKHAVAYVIGAVILFGVSGILDVILKVAESIKASGLK